MLEVRGIGISFDGRPVLRDASLTIGDADVVALLGPSGSGKSTLLRVIAGLLRPDRGHVLVDGADITAVATHRRNIGLVFQDDQLFPHRTVAQNVEFGLRMRRWDRARRAARVGELLDLVGLPGFEHRRVTNLSGGEAKRVALARTLAPSPRIVLLDEPLTGLDRELHDQLVIDLGALLRATATTALLVTHDGDEAAAIANRVVTMAELERDGAADPAAVDPDRP
jgi:thiamine transport system ATP-binding protein